MHMRGAPNRSFDRGLYPTQQDLEKSGEQPDIF